MMFRRMLYRVVRNENLTRRFSDSRTKVDRIKDGPDFHEFLVAGKNLPKIGTEDDTYLSSLDFYGNNRKVNFSLFASCLLKNS